jgi:hypothetical protein
VKPFNLLRGDRFILEDDTLCVVNTCVSLHPEIKGPERFNYLRVACTYPDGEPEVVWLHIHQELVSPV